MLPYVYSTIAKLERVNFDLRFDTSTESYILGPEYDKTTTSYVYINGNKIVGVLNIKSSRSGKTVQSLGTVVQPSYRKNGIAKDLWAHMLFAEKPKRIKVRVISDRGYSLINSIKNSFPDIKWFIEEDGSRKLRRLKIK